MAASPEQLRILRAARDGRIHSVGHWVIDGESRPERRALDEVVSNGWVESAIAGGAFTYVLTDGGRRVLDEAEREGR
jgi:hypothetical protein